MGTSMTGLSDALLVEQAVAGDEYAVAAIYDRYADAIYSFCRSRLRNEADAADAAQDTFVRAATHLGQLREPAKLRPWLYAIARNQIIAVTRRTSRLADGEPMEQLPAADADPDIDLLRVEAAAQLWDAADGLQDRDQEVLELHLRHGLIGQDLADALGVSESHANVLLSRMRDRVGVALGSLLVARRGTQDCEELGLLLAGWDGRFTLDVRSKVNRHVSRCETCERTKGTALASGISFGVLPIIPAPELLRASTIDSMSAAIGARSPLTFDSARLLSSPEAASETADWQWREDGFPGAEPERVSRKAALLLSAAALLVPILLVAGLHFLGGSDSTVVTEVAGVSITRPPESTIEPADGSTAAPTSALAAPTTEAESESTAASSTSTESTTSSEAATSEPSTTEIPTTAPTTTETTTTAAPPTTRPITTLPETTTTESTTTTTIVDEPDPPVPPDPPDPTDPPDPPNEAPRILLALVRPDQVEVARGRCAGETALISVEATDSDGSIVSVRAVWAPNGTTPRSTTLDLVGGTLLYRGSIGTWTAVGAQNIEIIATDNLGAAVATEVSVEVTACGGDLTIIPPVVTIAPPTTTPIIRTP